MKGILKINGIELEITLTPEQQEKVTEALKPKVAKRWEYLAHVRGWYIDNDSEVREVGAMKPENSNRNSFATKNQARGVLAMAQLSQLIKAVNGDWKPNWADQNTYKYIINWRSDGVITEWWLIHPHFLAFPTAEIRDQFLEDHRELIKEYFLIYQ